MVTFEAAATGATYFILSLKLSISKAEDVNPLAITSTTLSISVACKLNALKVEPPTSAAFAKSVSTALAKFKIPFVEFSISVSEKPNLPNSFCKLVTCVAV